MSNQPVFKTIAVLANSRKSSGRCIAGITVTEERKWVRPVSARPHGEVSEDERQYEDGSDPQLLYIVRVPLMRVAPSGYQTENWLLDPNFYWEKQGTMAMIELSDVDIPADLWVSGTLDSRHGLEDRVELEIASTFTNSLRLIHVSDLSYRVFAPSADFGDSRRRVQARFTYRRRQYWLTVTDPDVTRKYLGHPNGDHHIGSAYLTVSLGEPYAGHAYKLVAAVIPG